MGYKFGESSLLSTILQCVAVSKTSFTLVSIVIIIHSIESFHSDSFDGERLLCHIYLFEDISK